MEAEVVLWGGVVFAPCAGGQSQAGPLASCVVVSRKSPRAAGSLAPQPHGGSGRVVVVHAGDRVGRSAFSVCAFLPELRATARRLVIERGSAGEGQPGGRVDSWIAAGLLTASQQQGLP